MVMRRFIFDGARSSMGPAATWEVSLSVTSGNVYLPDAVAE